MEIATLCVENACVDRGGLGMGYMSYVIGY